MKVNESLALYEWVLNRPTPRFSSLPFSTHYVPEDDRLRQSRRIEELVHITNLQHYAEFLASDRARHKVLPFRDLRRSPRRV